MTLQELSQALLKATFRGEMPQGILLSEVHQKFVRSFAAPACPPPEEHARPSSHLGPLHFRLMPRPFGVEATLAGEEGADPAEARQRLRNGVPRSEG